MVDATECEDKYKVVVGQIYNLHLSGCQLSKCPWLMASGTWYETIPTSPICISNHEIRFEAVYMSNKATLLELSPAHDVTEDTTYDRTSLSADVISEAETTVAIRR